MQSIQDQARLAEANTQRELLTNEAHLAERARCDREELAETVIEARKTFEAERIALAMAARERDQTLIEHLHNQTEAVKWQVEREAENTYREVLTSERRAVMMANEESDDAHAVAAAVAVAK
eukprot:8127485-Pyramimonas_sp.AAC.1